MIDFHGLKCKLFLIYVVMDLRVAISRFLCVSTFFMAKTDYVAIIFSIFFLIIRVFIMEKMALQFSTAHLLVRTCVKPPSPSPAPSNAPVKQREDNSCTQHAVKQISGSSLCEATVTGAC